jgi:hypothetical protein
MDGAPGDEWIGLAHVVPRASCRVLESEENAFANVVGRALTKSEFKSEVAAACRRLNLELEELKDVALCEQRFEGTTIPEEIQTARAELAQGQTVAFGTFFTYAVD